MRKMLLVKKCSRLLSQILKTYFLFVRKTHLGLELTKKSITNCDDGTKLSKNECMGASKDD